MKEELFSSQRESNDDTDKNEQNRFDSILSFLRLNKEVDAEDNNNQTEKRKKGKTTRWRKFMRSLFGGSSEDNLPEDSSKPRRTPLISFEPISVAKRVEQGGERGAERNVEPTEEVFTDSNTAEADKYEPLHDHRKPQKQEQLQVRPEAKDDTQLHIDNEGINSTLHDAEKVVKQDTKTVAPNKAPTGVLLGIDYLNYRGRKKLEKKVEKQQTEQNQQIELLKKDLHKKELQVKRSEDAQTPVKLDKTKKEVLKDNVQAIDLPQPEVKVKFDHSVSENKTSDEVEGIKQKQPLEHQTDFEAIKLQQAEQKDIAHEAARLRKIDEKIEEQNIAQNTLREKLQKSERGFTEKQHERKNEVRDAASRLAPASSVASVIQGMNTDLKSVEGKNSSGRAAPSNNATTVDASSSSVQPVQQQMYRYAIKTGFATAVTLLAIAITISYII
jgi:hypothetical protein